VEQLKGVNATILGAVLNGVYTRKNGYYYSQYYYYYYGEDGDRKKRGRGKKRTKNHYGDEVSSKSKANPREISLQ
jgi:hypothetical protein